MSSLPSEVATAPTAVPLEVDGSATRALWRRLARPFDLEHTVDALLGLSPDISRQLSGTLLSTSPEAQQLLDEMPSLLRSLRTSVSANLERCRGELRGPVQWSETMSARASTYGSDDLFVCAAPQRAYDIDENRILAAALSAISKASHNVDSLNTSGGYDDQAMRQARANGRLARRYLEHRTLSGVRTDKVTPRALKRTRSGKGTRQYTSAIAMYERSTEPVGADDLLPYCDRRTRLQHSVLDRVLADIERRGMAIPALRVEAGSIIAGPVEYVHPRRRGDRSRLHGILIGELLIDVPDRTRSETRDRAQAALDGRSHGHECRIVLEIDDIAPAVDAAIRLSRSSKLARRGRAS